MGWPFFAELWRRRKNREIHLFCKMALLEAFCAFFWPPFPEALFSLTLVCCPSAKTSVEVDTPRNATKQGVLEPFRVSVPLRSLLAFRKGFILWTPLEDNFFRMLLFCTVRCSNFCRNWVSKVKKPLGLQNRGRFQKAIFRNVSAARANLARRGCAAVSFFSVDFGSLPKMSSRLRCGGFFRLLRFFLFDPVFKNLKWSSSHPPLFLWVFFSFGCILLGIGGNAALQLCFWAVGLQPFLFFGVFLEKHCFSPWKRVIWVHFSVSPFCVSLSFFLASFTSLCHSLSLSLYLFFFFFSYCFFFFFFLVVLFLFLPSLFYCCYFLSCCFVFVSWEEQHQHITFESFIFIIYVCLFFCFVFQICSYLCFFHYLSCVCWWTSMFSNFPRRPFLKHQFLFYTLWKVIVFFRAHSDWGKFWLMFTKHFKNRYFSTLLRTIKMNQIPFWGVVLWS